MPFSKVLNGHPTGISDTHSGIATESVERWGGREVVAGADVDSGHAEVVRHDPTDDGEGIVDDERRPERGRRFHDGIAKPSSETDKPTRYRSRRAVRVLDGMIRKQVDELPTGT